MNRWVSPLLQQARKQGTLQMTDLYDLSPHLESTKLTNELEANWFDEIRRNPEKPSFFRATLRTMRWKPLLFGLMLILKVSITLRLVLSFINHDVYMTGTIKYHSANFTRISHGLLRSMFYNARLESMASSFGYSSCRTLFQYYL